MPTPQPAEVSASPSTRSTIAIRGAREHNLRGVDIDIPRDKLVVMTGLSGSGKSSLAFDTIYAEGQRKYMESLSAYARQFLDQLKKPEIDSVEGLPPTIAIEQRSASHNPRSTVATTTEIYDYLRLLFARAGHPRCWHVETEGPEAGQTCGHPIASQSATQIVDHLFGLADGARVMILAPVVRGKKGHHKEVFDAMARQGFVRARVDGEVMDLREITASKAGTPFTTQTQRYQAHTIEAVVDRIVVRADEAEKEGGLRTRVADSVELSLKLADGLVIVAVNDAEDREKWTDTLFSEKHSCPLHPECSLEDLEPRLFSFNSPFGACPACSGLGTKFEFDPDLVVPDPEKSLAEGAIEPWRQGGKRMNILYARLVRRFCRDFEISEQTPFSKMGKPVQRILLEGTTDKDEAKYGHSFEGVLPNLQRRLDDTDSEFVKHWLAAYLSESPCEVCSGARLRRESRHVFLEIGAGAPAAEGLAERVSHRLGAFAHPMAPAKAASDLLFSIDAVVAMTIDQAMHFFEHLRLSHEETQIAEPILKEVRARLGFMGSVGLGYLNLSRATSTLSGGEAQRIRLATQVGSGLVGCCYVLDEPTIGLHQRDNDRLIRTLRHLTDIGNTVLVVEHDEDTIRAADYLIDVGPGAGRHGGTIVDHGTLAAMAERGQSLTARYMSGQVTIPTPDERRAVGKDYALQILGATENNLTGMPVTVPLGGITVVTGVSGSGKSTLVNHILLKAAKRQLQGSRIKPGAHEAVLGLEQIDRIIEVDQSPIGRTPRSNPATYTGVFDLIRTLFSQTKEAKIRGYKPGRFSFNVKGGRCEACQGQGTKKIEMHFLPDIFVDCDVCKGLRYNRETLEITYRGKTIADVLAMTVEEACEFFESFSDMKRLLDALNDVGLSYVQLGQASTTLSGGEAQRVKLATELGKRSVGHTLYVLDEPTTGLHFADVQKLLDVLHRLADEGHTLVIIEHNMDIIKNADWLLDLGPEGGVGGGRLVAEGSPEEVAQVDASHTGRFLRPHLPALA